MNINDNNNENKIIKEINTKFKKLKPISQNETINENENQKNIIVNKHKKTKILDGLGIHIFNLYLGINRQQSKILENFDELDENLENEFKNINKSENENKIKKETKIMFDLKGKY
jgi:hypothetical protein